MPDITISSNSDATVDNNNNSEIAVNLEKLKLEDTTGFPTEKSKNILKENLENKLSNSPIKMSKSSSNTKSIISDKITANSDDLENQENKIVEEKVENTNSTGENSNFHINGQNSASCATMANADVEFNPDDSSYTKSRLHSSWTLWFMNGDTKSQSQPDKNDEWSDKLIKLTTFDTVEDFWCVYSHIQLPAKLRIKNDYMLFRDGIRPEWEDISNKKGGSWKLVLPNKLRATDLDRLWLETVLSMIGEFYGDNGDYINGAYLQRRQKEDRIQMWTSDADKKDENENIGKQLKKTLNLTNDSQIHYLKHEDEYSETPGKHQSWSRKHKSSALYVV